MKKKNQTRQIMFHIWLKNDSEIRKQQIAICKEVNSKLEQLGYKIICFNEEYEGPYFLTIYDNNSAGWDSSITPACCMCNNGYRPLPIKWLYDHFEWIMDKHMNNKCWKLLEKIAYEYNKECR